MSKHLTAVAALVAALALAAASPASAKPFVRLTTDEGPILLELEPDLAPHHVANFVHLCRTGFYDGTTFHRVIPGFMIQGGDPNSKDADRSDDGQGGPKWEDVLDAKDLAMLNKARDMLDAKGYGGLGDQAMLKAEFNDAHHARGTLSMARAQDPDSAGSQFFITVADVPFLDHKYTVFGRVVTGMDAADAIVGAERDSRDNPLQPEHLKKAEVVDDVSGLKPDEKKAYDELLAGTDATTAQ